MEGVGGWRQRAAEEPRLRRIGGRDFRFGELRVKTLHRPRLMPAMAVLSIVGPLLGGIVVESLTSRISVWSTRPVGVVLLSSSARWCVGPAWASEWRLLMFASTMLR